MVVLAAALGLVHQQSRQPARSPRSRPWHPDQLGHRHQQMAVLVGRQLELAQPAERRDQATRQTSAHRPGHGSAWSAASSIAAEGMEQLARARCGGSPGWPGRRPRRWAGARGARNEAAHVPAGAGPPAGRCGCAARAVDIPPARCSPANRPAGCLPFGRSARHPGSAGRTRGRRQLHRVGQHAAGTAGAGPEPPAAEGGAGARQRDRQRLGKGATSRCVRPHTAGSASKVSAPSPRPARRETHGRNISTMAFAAQRRRC